MNRIARLLLIGIMLLTLPMRYFAQNSRTVYNQETIEFDITDINLFDERVFFIYNLVNDSRFVVKASEEDGIFLINANDAYEDMNLEDSFLDFCHQNTASFGQMDKAVAADVACEYKALLPLETITSLMMDYYVRSRQNNHCADADPFCTDNGMYQFPAGVNAGTGETGPNYNCLGSEPNPAWYYMQIDQPGDIDIYMYSTPSKDIDFCCWGPFDDPHSPCPNGLTANKVVSCSYSANPTEHCMIPATSQHGEYYILIITNYSNSACNISFSKVAGSGTTNCGIMPPLVDNDGPYCVGETIYLTANSNGQSGATFNWTGPGGFTSSQQNPTRPNCTMAMAGTYTCTITVGSQTNNATTEVVIYPQPTANFTFASVCKGMPTQFTNTSTTNPSGQQMTYQWNFGDGGTSTEQNPSHTYAQAGNYTVQLIARAGNGVCTSEKTQTVPVYAAPTANFNYTSVCKGNPTQFTNTSITDPSGQQMTYQWNFGDGGTSTEQNPSHTYAQAGNYTVQLTARTGSDACASQMTQTVPVYAAPIATASANPTVVMYGGASQLSASAGVGGQFNFQWEPADKVLNPTSQNTLTVGLQETTTFTVTVTNPQGGCYSTAQVTVSIEGSGMTATASATPAVLCEGESTTLHANPTGGTGNYTFLWSPEGTLSNPSSQNPTATPPVGTTHYTCQVGDGYSTQNVSVDVIVHPNTESHPVVTICPDDTYNFFGQDINEPGPYQETTTNHFGCDSTVYLTLQHYETYDEDVVTEQICYGEHYSFFGHDYYTSCSPANTFEVLQTVHGCDSIVRLDLTVYPANDTTIIDPAICVNQTYNFHGNLYHNDGDIAFFDTLDNHGCLKVEKLILSVGEYQMPPVEERFICYGHDDTPEFTWDKNGLTYTSNTDDEVILPDPTGGCDFKYRLKLRFHQDYYQEFEVKTCDAYTWPVTGQTYTHSDVITKSFSTGAPYFSCDSTLVLKLTVTSHDEETVDLNDETAYGYDEDNSCDDYFWNPDGKNYWDYKFQGQAYSGSETISQSGTYERTYKNLQDCDSIVTLKVQFEYTPNPTDSIMSPDANIGVATHAVINASEFQINTYDFTIHEQGLSHHWDSVVWSLKRQDGSDVPWDLRTEGNGQVLHLTVFQFEPGTLNLSATAYNRCGSSTRTHWLKCTFYGIDEEAESRVSVDIVPNPNNGLMTLNFDYLTGNVNIKVYDMKGNMIDSFNTFNSIGPNSMQYSMKGFSDGLYHFVISGKEGTVTKKVIIKK